MSKSNPLLQKTPYKNNVPPFDLVKTEHFIAALEEAIKQAKQEVEVIKKNSIYNFNNTIEAFEKTGELLSNVCSVFYHFDGVLISDELDAIAPEFKKKVTEYYSDISLDAELFSAIKTAYNNTDKNSLNESEKILLQDSYDSFVRNGALLNDEDKQKLRKIDEKLALLKNNFSKNILLETNAFEYYSEGGKEVSGLTKTALAQAKAAAKERGKKDKYLFTLHAPSVIAVLTYADDRELRKKIWQAFATRCKKGEFSNQQNTLEIAKLRYERAKLLGYKNHAEYVLSDRMAKNSENVHKRILSLKDRIRKLALKEHENLRKFAEEHYNIKELKPWDIGYFAEKQKKSIFDFDAEELRPYFQFEKVRQGAFKVAEKLYNIRFEQSDSYPLYHADVEAFDVINNDDNSLVGVFYTDYFPRESKRAGAWMNDYVAQKTDKNGNRLNPVIGNHGNFTKPTEDSPSLLDFNEVLTLFHEFGHGLHGLLSDTKYSSQAGTNVKWDFVELPSQIMENWAKEKEVLDIFAKHYETGAAIPKELVNKLIASENFRAATRFLRQLQFVQLDMAWHDNQDESIFQIDDVAAFEHNLLRDYYIIEPEGAVTSTAFSHIFDGGYSAGYYSYKWAEILDADAFELFKQKGLFDEVTAKAFRKLLSSGGSKDAENLYKEFRGQAPDPEALLRRENL